MKTLIGWIRSLFPGNGRSRLLSIRRRHGELLDERGKYPLGSSEWFAANAKINRLYEELDQLEAELFGPK